MSWYYIAGNMQKWMLQRCMGKSILDAVQYIAQDSGSIDSIKYDRDSLIVINEMEFLVAFGNEVKTWFMHFKLRNDD